MALELNGQPYSLTKAEVEKYTGKYIFRVGTQYITDNTRKGDPELKAFEVAPVHINTIFNHFKMEGKTRMSQGVMRYYETKDYDEGAKRFTFGPSRIPIGYTGYIETDIPELSFFLDNHPANEKVKADPSHINHDPKMQTYFATYDKANRQLQTLNEMQTMSELLSKVLDKQSFGEHELRAIASLVVKSANDYKIAHKLINLSQMNESGLRAEISRLCGTNPYAMKEIMASNSVDFLEWINKFRTVDVVKLKNNEWVITESGKSDIPLVRVESGTDAESTLVDFFKNFDRLGSKFKLLKQLYAEIIERRKKTEKV